MPLPRGGKVLDYSRWQQNLIGILQTDIAYNEEVMLEPRAIVTLDTRLAYRNKGDPDGDWKHYSSSLEQRELDCTGEDVSVNAFRNFYLGKKLLNNSNELILIIGNKLQMHHKINLINKFFNFISNYLMSIYTHVQRYLYSNSVHYIMIFIC